MRGRLDGSPYAFDEVGNTPAHAGKTLRRPTGHQAGKKHPRACGEDLPCDQIVEKSRETPPRMRGRLARLFAIWILARNTPAHAGKTIIRKIRILIRGKHPRACGEDWVTVPTMSSSLETPPRMRGRRTGPLLGDTGAGNTPAHAGKTYRQWCRIPYREKHPRACGEDDGRAGCRQGWIETPPRMRGRRSP